MSIFEETEEQRIFRQEFRKFCAREITPNVELWERQRAVPRELWRKMGEQGYLCAWLPETFGGLGLDFHFSVIIGEELIRADGFGVGAPLHSDVAVPYIFSYGSEAVKERILPKCVTGEVITCIGLTEPNAGSDLAAIRTRAVRDGDHYVIDGQKTFITNGIFADAVVLAVKMAEPGESKGISLILVEAGTPGFSRGRKLEKLGYHMQDTAELFFEDCRVPVENLLGEEGRGFKYMMEKLARERLEVCVKCQAMAEECLKEALSYSKMRHAFNRPIATFQHNAFKLAEMATEVDIGRTYLNTLVAEFVKGDAITLKVSMAKAWLGEMVNRVAYNALQLHGGYGYMEEYRISRLFRDARSLSIFAGTTEIMKLIIARRLGLNPV
ncbi:MAG: acyl-CoA dehydrogenase [Deltaproteobacteria bacterium CG23_combo_of_CG06-09_8_20_14_all_51_20]|nr:MAG: acyl-CoA dehydrogenase [Desulfobacteraceae bacterium CG2_30_51_40]PIP47795.1 MAG: acyl-CoA dehydrogenase [Deltaproteobacteria bacterium CG23_combo_of_CG06-09_8_20_14_all_51_20]PIY22088.1 MAG: acyl-CoA dehydrogenase [Deltaproteobacteria bacterium CG_4_10_14_3_um_filter_51_14]